MHPFNSEFVRLYIGLIENEDEGKLGLVQYANDARRIILVSHRRQGWPLLFVYDWAFYAYLQAYSILDIKVAGAVVRGVSMMYATTVGNEAAIASVMMAPDADQVNISICPGVSSIT